MYEPYFRAAKLLLFFHISKYFWGKVYRMTKKCHTMTFFNYNPLHISFIFTTFALAIFI